MQDGRFVDDGVEGLIVIFCLLEISHPGVYFSWTVYFG